MRIFNYTRKTVNEVLEQMPEAKQAFYERNISASSRLSLANAADATSVSTDEVMAVLDHRTRRAAARRRETTPASAETELV